MSQTVDRGPTRVLRTGPEELFDISEVTVEGDLVSGSMPTGTWLDGPGGAPAAGALGVLVDDVLGYAVMAARPPEVSGMWSVSAEISIDLVGPLPRGARLHAEARTDHAHRGGGIASGRVVDDEGRLVALCRQHGRSVDRVPKEPDGSAPAPAVPSEHPDAGILALLGAEVAPFDGGAELLLEPSARLVNPLGVMHGGISLCASELAASAALGYADRDLATATIRVNYVRPLPLDAPARFRATVVHAGRGLGVVQVTSYGAAGKPCTIATVTAASRCGGPA